MSTDDSAALARLPLAPGSLGEVSVRAWEPADAAALNAAVAVSLEHLRPWMSWVAQGSMSLRDRVSWIEERRSAFEQPGQDANYGIFYGDEVAGACGLHRRIGEGGLEIGYWVRADLTRRGIATSAVRILTAAAFAIPGIERVEIHHDNANIASGKTAAAAGYTLVAEVADEPEAPAESGIECQWQLRREQLEWPRPRKGVG